MQTNIPSTPAKKEKGNYNSLLHKILSLSILFVVTALLLCSSVPITNEQDAFPPFVFALVLAVVSIISTVMAFIKKKNRKVFAFIQLLIIGLCVVVILFSILHCFGVALIKIHSSLPIAELVGCIICSFVIIVMAVITFITTIKVKDGTVANNEETAIAPTNSSIEAELKEVKALFEKGLLNEDDYNLAKQTIIKKYYD
ncbi:MAG: hypothetical protein IKC64_00525 [Clostridia bacterium]|nr:hypothetical protein [Clostridia bacterium]